MSKPPNTDKTTDEQANNSTLPNEIDSAMEHDQWITESLQAHLDAQVDDLDFNISSKLSAARHRALAQEHGGQVHTASPASWLNWSTAMGTTAVLAITFFIALPFFPAGQPQTSTTDEVAIADQLSGQVLMEDLNLLSASEDIEFYQAVEFLEWMESQSG